MTAGPHILIVDDDLEIRKLLGRYLTEQNFRVTLASDHRTLRAALTSNEINLIVLDVMLPDGSGTEICRVLKSTHPNIPIILLTALKEDVDRIIGLEMGADDYVGKPFNPRELAARIRAVLRRQDSNVGPSAIGCEYRFDDFSIQTRLRQVSKTDGTTLDFTGAEFELLHTLAARPGRILSRDQLLDLTKHDNLAAFDRSVDVLLSRIRKKLGPRGFELIKTVRNGGYIFTAQVQKIGVDE